MWIKHVYEGTHMFVCSVYDYIYMLFNNKTQRNQNIRLATMKSGTAECGFDLKPNVFVMLDP